MSIDLSDYVPVAERIVEFKKKFPDGSLVSEVIQTGHEDYIAVKALCYRVPDDPHPGVGLAWEKVPGPTPFTKNSELQNAETSAWGRALIAALVADSSRGIASRDEVDRPAEEPTREDVEQSPGDWLKVSVEAFGLWTPEDSRAAYQVAMTGLEFKKLSSMSRAKKVFERMADAYREAHPEAGLF